MVGEVMVMGAEAERRVLVIIRTITALSLLHAILRCLTMSLKALKALKALNVIPVRTVRRKVQTQETPVDPALIKSLVPRLMLRHTYVERPSSHG
jgi:transcription-repair coupling factor (superfamily II helicase)